MKSRNLKTKRRTWESQSTNWPMPNRRINRDQCRKNETNSPVNAASEHNVLSGSIVVSLMVYEAGLTEPIRFLNESGCPTPHASQGHGTGRMSSWHSEQFRSRPGERCVGAHKMQKRGHCSCLFRRTALQRASRTGLAARTPDRDRSEQLPPCSRSGPVRVGARRLQGW